MHKIGIIVNGINGIGELDSLNSAFSREMEQGSVLCIPEFAGNLEKQVRFLEAEGAEAIIVRGGFAKTCQQLTSLLVYKIWITVSDVLLAITETQSKYAHIYLVLSKHTNFDFSIIEPYLDKKVTYIEFEKSSEEIAERIRPFLNEPNVLFMGSGYIPREVDGKPLNVKTIHNSARALRMAYDNVIQILNESQIATMKKKRLELIVSAVDFGILEIDETGIITVCNTTAKNIMKNYGIMIGSEPERLPVSIKNALASAQMTGIENQIVNIDDQKFSIAVKKIENHKMARYIIFLRNISKIQSLEMEVRHQLNDRGFVAKYSFENILTCDENMRSAIHHAKECAGLDYTVLLFGQSGCGKELFAQSIHNASKRRSGPFVAVNCAALTETLLESELFGYADGAFTGAKKGGKPGLLEQAHRGTLFLDEINSMSASTQSKLLRVLEQKEIMRIGSDRVIPIDIRIIAATNSNLMDHVERGEFRRDLYYRLDVLEINLPVLRERPKDISYLFKHFVAKYAGCEESTIKLTDAFEEKLMEYEWPGNVRELRNIALRYTVYHSEEEIIKELTKHAENTGVNRAKMLVDKNLNLNLKEVENTVDMILIDALVKLGYKKEDIASILGISKATLFRKLP